MNGPFDGHEENPVRAQVRHAARSLMIRWEQGRYCTAIVILDEPQCLRLVWVVEYLEVIKAILLASEVLKPGQTVGDCVSIDFDCRWGRKEWFIGAGLEHVP